MATENEILFKQAINEALSNKFQRMIDDCEEEIVCSRRHKRIMKAIVYGNATKVSSRMSTRAKIAAVLVAAALLLGGCAIAYRAAIRSFVSEIKEFFVELTFTKGDDESKYIEEVYELTCLPEGYGLESQNIACMRIQYVFVNAAGQKIKFIQQPIDASSFTVDTEHGYENIFEVEEYEIYYRQADGVNCYIWNDGKYALQLYSTVKLSDSDIKLIIDGIT